MNPRLSVFAAAAALAASIHGVAVAALKPAYRPPGRGTRYRGVAKWKPQREIVNRNGMTPGGPYYHRATFRAAQRAGFAASFMSAVYKKRALEIAGRAGFAASFMSAVYKKRALEIAGRA